MVVLVIIGLIASVALPRWINTQDQALFRSLQLGVKVIKKQVDLRYHTTGSWPTTVESNWFAGNMLPRHLENTFDVPPIEVVSQPGKLDPDDKVLKAGVGGAFWYNRAEGIVRVRVAARATALATAVRYNGINERSITDLGNYEESDEGS
jgi:type II secretory pathway pseudopilin PulG